MGKLELLDRVTYCFGGVAYSGVIVGRYDFADNLHLPTGERTVYMTESALKKEGGKETLE